MKAYLATTGTIFGLLAVGHVFELTSGMRASPPDYGFIWGVAAVIVLSAALSAWAFRLFKAAGGTAGN